MKNRIGYIFAFIGLGISILFSLVFAFIELRSLFASDFLLFNNPIAGAFSYLFRGLYFLGILSLDIFIIIWIIKRKERFLTLFLCGTGLFISSFFTFAFYVWFIGLIILIISFIPTLVTFLLLKKR